MFSINPALSYVSIKKKKSLSSVSHHKLCTFVVCKSFLIKRKKKAAVGMGENLKQI